MAHLHPLHLGVDGVHRVVLGERRLLLLPASCEGINKSPSWEGSRDLGRDPGTLPATAEAR